MNQVFSKELVFIQNDDGYYTPEKLAELKLTFERTCVVAGISAEPSPLRDEVAILILVGSKIYKDEDLLMQAISRVISRAH
jgi:hypothetical protein